MNKVVLTLACLCFSLPAEVHGSNQTIKKCQDAEGKWHYGDQAATACENSAITEIDETGVQVKQIKAPPTQEELDAKRRLEDRLAERAESEARQQAQDQRLLATYENEDAIVRTRDAIVAAVDSAIDADRALKQRLVQELEQVEAGEAEDRADKAAYLRTQIGAFDDSIRKRLASKEQTRQRYDEHLARFRELTQREPAAVQ